MFTKILIANRGEIACRVIKTAKRIGIATVAVYSDADAQARHVRLADEAVRIGPAAARESYLVGERILEAAKRTGAQAVHPGYGFLSENEDFAEACARAGIVFIGPPASAIRAMGSKSAAKQLMEQAGVPLTPGYHGARQEPAFLAEQAARIGYPVLIKASAGGGGKGMRRVDAPADFEAALMSCRREAANAFGDEHVLVEKYVLQPRHIEIQVFGDTHGNVVHLFERDCSVQRRHQKVLEEAPAPGMTAERRARMGQAAVEAAKAVGYVGAGTVEFIAQPGGSFYFMEMNTRLQVEHPVTEMITGLDLVEWQLRVASGEPLPLRQDQLALRGHAIEARIYAEDADAGFLPSTGQLVHLSPPPESAHVRIDTGVDAGDEITPHYDPMIAKLIVHGHDRRDALARMRTALSHYRVVGVRNNVEFLSRLVATRSFAEADLDTALIEREHANLFPPTAAVPDDVWLLAAQAELLREAQRNRVASAKAADRHSPWHAGDGWRLNGTATSRLTFRFGDEERTVQAQTLADGHNDATAGDSLSRSRERAGVRAFAGRHPHPNPLAHAEEGVSAQRMASAFHLLLDGPGPGVVVHGHLTAHSELDTHLGDRRLHAVVIAHGERRHVFVDGRAWVLTWVDPLHTGSGDAGAEGSLRAPMPGKVVAVKVEAGAKVEKGAPLVVLEAMKMEHTITAPQAGVVKAVCFAAGELVDDGAELVIFEDAA